jgi:hypothetical protein
MVTQSGTERERSPTTLADQTRMKRAGPRARVAVAELAAAAQTDRETATA